MTYESVQDIKKLAEDAGVLLLAPFIFLCLGVANAYLPYNRDDKSFRKRLVLTLAIAMFIFAICTVIVQDRTILVRLWEEAPILYSLVYLIGAALGAGSLGTLIYGKLRPELWRRDQRE